MRSQQSTRTRHARRAGLFTTFTAALMIFTGHSAVASAQEPPPFIDEIEIVSNSGGQETRLSIDFDKPISQEEADRIRERFDDESSVAMVAPRAAAAPPSLRCRTHRSNSDRNGKLTLQFNCFPQYGTVTWGYDLSPQVRATVVGPVREAGLSWWRNTVRQAQNAPHTVPADYRFHGTMSKVWVNDIIDYQDVFTYRHNIGTGGTARLVFAGSLRLTL